MEIHSFGDLRPRSGRPRVGGSDRLSTADLVVGQWSLTAAAWTDRHQHEEINYVLEGELHVSCGGETRVVIAGEAVLVPAGARARYAAPEHARMLFVYGPSDDGHAASDVSYEELTSEA